MRMLTPMASISVSRGHLASLYGEAILCKSSLDSVCKPRSFRKSIKSNHLSGKSPPLLLTTDSAAVDVEELSFLLASPPQLCQNYPLISDTACLRRPDPVKLHRALRNSTCVVAMYVKGCVPGGDYYPDRPIASEGEGIWQWLPWASARRCLVGFGRATSDCALTACIHDLVVIPALENSGIGRLIIQRIVRDLIRKEIYDIAVLARPDQREFFVSCGFGDDALGSTTMIYPCTTPN